MSTDSKFNSFQITAYKDVDCSQNVTPKSQPAKAFDSSKLMYIFPFNPSSVKIQGQHHFNLTQPTGFGGLNPKFISIKPRLINIELIVDPGAQPNFMYAESTGLPVKETKLTLSERIEIFEDIVGYESTTHRPHYLLLTWGDTINLKTTLKEYQIVYGRFSAKGVPTRATIQAQFLEVVSTSSMLSQQSRQSPDVSHQIEIKDGDNIINLCEKIYGNSKYYIEIAKINGLKSIRNVKIGDILFFPPLK
jgi:hypothetical protein